MAKQQFTIEITEMAIYELLGPRLKFGFDNPFLFFNLLHFSSV